MRDAFVSLPADQRDALTRAAARVRPITSGRRAGGWSFTEADGTELGQRVTPLDRVGIYVPGGKAAYPSSVLMNAIPAHVAGVREIVMVVPTPDGVRNPLVLAAAQSRGRHARIHDRRRAGDCRARVRHADRAGRRQDLRAGQRVRRRGQAPRVRHRRHRHGRRRFGNRRGRRRHRESGLGRARPLLAGRARRNGAGDPADARRRAHRPRRRERAPFARRDAARGHHPGVARRGAARW